MQTKNQNAVSLEPTFASVEKEGDGVFSPAKANYTPIAELSPDAFDSGDQSSDDSPASIPRTVCSMVGAIIPAGGFLSAGFNLASTSIGAGILGLPSAFKSVGILMAAFYLILVTAETVYSMNLLVQCSEKTGLRTFESMARNLLHPKGALFVAIIRFMHSFGACVAYVVTIGDLVKPILENSGVPGFLTSNNGVRLMQTLLWLVFFLPLSIPRRINSLRYVSAAGLAFILFFCGCIMVHSGTNGLQQHPRPKTKLANSGNDAIQGLGVFIFSYMCQVNCVEIYMELTKRDVRRFTLCAAISMSVCGVLYFLTGLFGYLDFGSAIDGSILNEFNPVDEPQMMVSYIGIFVKICASYGLLGHVCRTVVYQLLNWKEEEVPFLKHLCVVLAVAVGSLLCGLFIPDINMVFGFIGGFCGGFIAFILPALFTMYSGRWSLRSVGWVHYISTYLVLMAGVVAIVFGTGSTIYSACT